MPANKTGKNLLLIIAVILLIAAVVWFVTRQPSSAPAIRHVVLISIDTCRADYLSCYGYPKPTTPNIDALASQGYLFSNTVTPIPLTVPAHTSMFTGTIPPRHGKHENKDVYFDPSLVTLAQLFKAKGYSTGAFTGSQAMNHALGLDRGFDIYDDHYDQPERPAGDVNRSAFQWLEKQKGDPLFLFLHYYDPHDAYDPPEPFATRFKDSPYAGEIAYTDHCIGQVFAKLKSLNMYESSLIIVTGDHGEMLGEHGEPTHMYFIYQSAMKVPLIYKLPGSTGAQRIDDLTSIIDILPTVCDLVGLEPPAGIQGKNMAGYFSNNPPDPKDRHLYCESLYPTKYEANSLLGIISQRWKYIQTTRPELYDLQNDPDEQTNLLNEKPQLARILKDRLAQILETTVRKGSDQQDTPLDDQTLQHLSSLGYVTGSSVTEDFSFDQSKTDPKDLIGYHNDSREISHLVRQEKYSDALVRVERLAKQRPLFGLYELASHIATQQKDYKAVVAYGEKALELEGDFKIYVKFHYDLAIAYAQLQQNEKAAVQFELILEQTKYDPKAFRERRVQVHNELGGLRSKQKKFKLAIAQYQYSMMLDHMQPGALNALALILLNCPDEKLRNPAKAVDLANLACTITKFKHPMYLNTLTIAYYETGNYAQAVEAAQQALALAKAAGEHELAARLQQQLDHIKKAWAQSVR
jgi:arylsulfatase A-like enzyme